jgi:hypothetical protein
MVAAGAAINATLYEKLNFNFIREFAPVAGIIRTPLVMEVNPSFPAKSVSEFIAYSKANPGKISMASGGNGTSSHMSGELFKALTGINMVHVPYRGDAPARAYRFARWTGAGKVRHDASISRILRACTNKATYVRRKGPTRCQRAPLMRFGGHFRPRSTLHAKTHERAPTQVSRCYRTCQHQLLFGDVNLAVARWDCDPSITRDSPRNQASRRAESAANVPADLRRANAGRPAKC